MFRQAASECENPDLVIIDFGFAQLLPNLTASGTPCFTLGFAAPEILASVFKQGRPRRNLDGGSDVAALGSPTRSRGIKRKASQDTSPLPCSYSRLEGSSTDHYSGQHDDTHDPRDPRLAPSTSDNSQQKPKVYGENSDLWSLGVILVRYCK